MNSLKQWSLITGASGGIGYELATVFAKNGWNLVLVARSEEKLIELKNKLESAFKIRVEIISIDLSQRTAPQKVFDSLQKKHISILALVNNAGFGVFGKFSETSLDKEINMIDLNIVSLTILTKLFLKEMIQNKKGYILNIASTAAFQAGPLMAIYYATKAYVLLFSEAISNELKGTGVTVTAYCPGATQTGFQAAANAEKSALFQQRKLPSAQEVAEDAYKALLKKKTVAIHGLVNWTLANSVRFMPRKVITSIVRKIQKQI